MNTVIICLMYSSWYCIVDLSDRGIIYNSGKDHLGNNI